MQPQAILLLFLVAAEEVTHGQAIKSESLMDRAETAVRQRIEQLTDEYAKDLEVLAKLYQQSGDLAGKAAVNAELTRVRQTRQIIVPNFDQLPAGIAALEASYRRLAGEETVRVLHPLVMQRREEIAKRKEKGDFATAMIMEKELDAVCKRFGWETKKIPPDNT